jgi:hypothetical protein
MINKNRIYQPHKEYIFKLFVILMLSAINISVFAQSKGYHEYKGKVIDENTGHPLSFAAITIEGTNIATVTNAEGEFVLKVPREKAGRNLLIAYIGYKSKNVPISTLNSKKNKIKLELLSVSLAEINIFPKDARLLMQAVLSRRKENYTQYPAMMTAFYRETIKKRRTYASLAEAVLQIYKQPYKSIMSDQVKLLKARKNADYTRLDTMVFKLMGGPYNCLVLDIMKNNNLMISYESMDEYDFSFDNITRINDRLLYIISFKQKKIIDEPLPYGKLYIDSESLAITKAIFNINTENKEEVSKLFIKKKPAGANVYITNASYMVNYREIDGKWYYGHSRGEMTVRVDWDKKFFNTTYTSQFEMAITDWHKAETKSPIKPKEKMKKNIIMRDREMGFADKNFWGAYNVIEPEKPIENAIRKIQKNLKKLDK